MKEVMHMCDTFVSQTSSLPHVVKGECLNRSALREWRRRDLLQRFKILNIGLLLVALAICLIAKKGRALLHQGYGLTASRINRAFKRTIQLRFS